jgi:acyl-CoA thioesterase I
MAECAQFSIAKCRPAVRCFTLVLLFTVATPTNAAEIVALGASGTAGAGQGRHSSGVSRDQAYPAQLEAMLRAQNCAVSVENSGSPGDIASSMLARLPGLFASDTRCSSLKSRPVTKLTVT